MNRRSFADVAAVARDQERDACIAHIREKIAEVDGVLRRGRLPAVEADMLKRRLGAVADGLKAGLHRDAPIAKGSKAQ